MCYRLSDEEFSAWLADVVSKQNKNRLEWYWWLKKVVQGIKNDDK